MSETEPTFSPRPTDERDELARLEAQLAKKKVEVNGNTEFGKYDTTVPNEGEDTYQTYLDQRPAEGVVRDGESFRDNGKFASADAYAEQNGTAEAHYDEVNGIETEVPSTNFEDLSFMQLASELAKANELGDRAGAQEIRAAAEHKIMDQITRPGYETADAETEYADEVARFNATADKLSKTAPNEVAEATTVQPPLETESVPTSAYDSEEEEEAGEATPVSPNVALDSPINIPEANPTSIEVELPVFTEVTPDANEQVLLNGENVAKEGYMTLPDGTKLFRVTNAEGETLWAGENVLEVSNLDDAEVQAEPDNAEKEGRFARVKAWAAANKEKHFDNFSNKYMAKLFTMYNSVLDYRTNDSMDSGEIDRIRNVNRRALIIGGAALGVLGLIGIGVSLTEHAGDTDTSSLPDMGNGDGGASAEGQAAADAAAAEAAQHTAEEAATTQLFDIPRGQGGLELFRNLGIDPSKWAANAPNFPSMFPNDFTVMDGGGIGIKHSGWISPEAQEFIKKLR